MATHSLTRRCAGLTSTTPASVVQGFIKTATTTRSFHQNTPRPVFDFLVPRLGAPLQSAYPLKQNGLLRNPVRCFSTTRTRKATITTFNPQKNEDGTEQKIEITSRAADRLQQLRKKENNPNLALRVEVQSKCYAYVIYSSKSNNPTTLDLREDDTVFSYISDQSHASVVMDVFSLDALKGSRIDYEVKLIGSEFKIVDNPAATSSCGCGTSFDIKF
ncbi:putative iron-sulfur cluster assembly accessory protein [Botrytis fragariae]|uniref:Putative iron-sulfur cluster assembly accessory protein n=1 Tax=Botrytis fragariae TaxID=1964551 RepID=A0A8H6EKJ3_9HELO|nr:putative iron-sulfur cluster assembly accessory protein [Botrytis fragariae]KAF5875628.1 putative iron-sulfur cluster assembly accessory protein [Botrytis fragariae]